MVINLQNLRIKAREQEPTEEIKVEETALTGGVGIDSLQKTGADFKQQATDFGEEEEILPTFNIRPKIGLDEGKITRFIQKGVEKGKTREEIENAYQKALDSGFFKQKEERQFDDGGTFKKVLTKALPQIGGDIKEGLFRLGADISKFQRGAFKEEILGADSEKSEIEGGVKKGILGRIGSSIIQRERGLTEKKAEQGDIGQTGIEKGVEQFGQGVGVLNDVIGEGFMSILGTLATDEQEKVAKQIIKNVATSEKGQKAGEIFADLKLGFEKFERQNPRSGSFARTFGNVAELGLELFGAGTVKRGAKRTLQEGEELAEKAVKLGRTGVEKGEEVLKQAREGLGEIQEKGLEGLGDIAERKSTKLESKAREQVRNEAEKIALPTLEELNKRGKGKVFKDVVEEGGKTKIIRDPKEVIAIEEVARLIDEGKIKKNITEVKKRQIIDGEIEKISKELDIELKKSDAKLTKDEMLILFDDLGTKILDNPVMSGSPKTSVKNLLLQLNKKLTKNDYFPEDILQLRKDFDADIRKFKGDKPFSPDLENSLSIAIRDFRQGLNNKIGEMVPDVDLKNKLNKQSGLFEVKNTLGNRFASDSGSFVKRTLQKIEDFTGVPRTEIIEGATALGLIGVGTGIAIPIGLGVGAIALGRKGLQSLGKATNKRKVAKLLKSLDEKISKNPSEASKLKQVRDEIKKLSEDKKIKEKSVENRLDSMQKILDIITPSEQLKLPQKGVGSIKLPEDIIKTRPKQPGGTPTPSIQATEKPKLQLPEGKRIIPQTAEEIDRGIILESKKGLGGLKLPKTKPVKKVDKKNGIEQGGEIPNVETAKSANFKQSNLNNLIQKAKESGKLPLNDEIATGFIEKPNILQRKIELDKIKDIIKQEANIQNFVPKKTLDAIEQYTKHQGRINAFLRNPKGTHTIDSMRRAREMKTELLNLPKFEGISYRGVKDFEGLQKLKVGDTFSDDAFLSSSKSKLVADRFAKDALFIIKGKKGRDLSNISKVKSEQEILFKPDTEFNIISIEQKGGKKIITLEE